MRNEEGRKDRKRLGKDGELGKELLSHVGHVGMVALFLASACTGAVNGPTTGSTGTGTNTSGNGTGSGPSTSNGTGPTSPTGTTGTTAGNTMAPGTGTSGGATTTTGGSGTQPTAGASTTAGLWDNLPAAPTVDSGRVTLRRLNNAEYDNTTRDLIGTMSAPSQTYMFPDDDVNELFDTNGQTLVYSDLLFAQVQSAAQGLAAELLARPATDPIRTRILSCTPTVANFSTCLTTILTPFMTSAYRRPVTAAEVSQIVTVAAGITTAHSDPQPGLSAGLQAVLMSPYFLFRLEMSINPTSTTPAKLNDYELATRLSYFLGSTMPDAQLMAAAAAGKLAPAGADYTSQIDRLTTDPVRAQAFVDNFAARWLSLSDTALVAPDDTLFAGKFDDALRLSIPQETSMFFASLMSDKQPLATVLTANFTFVNARLAQQYGVTAPSGTGFAKVSLAGNTQRMGLLTQETYLTVTSLPTRTSPVKRGVWVLDNLLCDGTAAPPPGIPELPAEGTGTVRQVLAQHRAQPYCSSCHSLIDPIGVTFENYDAIGSYRTQDNGQPVDATSTLPNGTAVNGALALSNAIAKDPRLVWCLTKQVMTYGVGRTFDAPDSRAYLKSIGDPLRASGTWPDLVKAVATSTAFLTSRGEGP
jgi:hypothetical protein